MIILETDRLILRTWRSADIVSMAEISSDPRVMEYFPALQDLDGTKQLIDHINSHFNLYGYALYATEIKETKEFIGFVGLNIPYFTIPSFKPKGLPIVEIGWRLGAKHWGQGYATEAAKAVLRYGFIDLSLKEVISFTAKINIRSSNLMEKIGLHHHLQDDFDHPKLEANSPLKRHVLYRLTQEEYLEEIHNA